MYQSGYIESLCASVAPRDFSRHPHGEFTAIVRTVKAGESQNGKPFHEIVLETSEGQPKPVRVWGFSQSDEQLAGHDKQHREKIIQQIQITKGQLVRWGLCSSEHIAKQGWRTQGGVVDQLASMIGRSFRIAIGPDRKDAKYDNTEIIEMIPGVLQPALQQQQPVAQPRPQPFGQPQVNANQGYQQPLHPSQQQYQQQGYSQPPQNQMPPQAPNLDDIPF